MFCVLFSTPLPYPFYYLHDLLLLAAEALDEEILVFF
jgi:hypothetical protein